MPVVLSMVQLHLLGHNDPNEVKHENEATGTHIAVMWC